MRVEQVTRELLIQRCVGRTYSEISQLCLRLRPGKIQRSTGAVGVVIKIGELNRLLAARRDEGCKCHFGRSAGRYCHSRAQRKNRIEYRTDASGELGTV